LVFVLILLVFLEVTAECPNACSGHGKCGAFNTCKCDKRFMGNDCSERVCQFGVSLVDAPKGDLDATRTISGADELLIVGSQIYPKGTTEVWTNVGATTTGDVLTNTGHGYAECSNAGWCDRSIGECQCYEGYEGSSCQRMECPKSAGAVCSGHGICVSISRYAEMDNGNEYKLWDGETTRGCHCDPQYYGPDCSRFNCEYGVDPLYYTSPEISARYANWSIVIAHANMSTSIQGTFTLTFYDVYDEDYTTRPLPYDASCREMIEAIEGLPNHYVRAGSVKCLKFEDYAADTPDEPFRNYLRGPRYGVKYTVVMPSVVGKTKQPHVNVHDQESGKRQTLQSLSGDRGMLGTQVYPNGFTGEFVDYVGDLCSNVDVTLQKGTNYDTLGGLTYMETRLLMKCLGDADGNPDKFDATSAVLSEAFTWDYGSYLNPHLIKLVEATPGGALTDICKGKNGRTRGQDKPCIVERPPGFYAFLTYHAGDREFRLFNPAASDFGNTTEFNIYTTKGTMRLVSNFAGVDSLPHAEAYSREVRMAPSTDQFVGYAGSVDCESNPVLENGLRMCVEKNDKLFFFANDMNEASHASNPRYPNMYTLERAYLTPEPVNGTMVPRMVLDYSMTGSWHINDYEGPHGRVYHFTPNGDEVRVVGPCSFRGECSTNSGQCKCHTGFYGQDCSEMVAVNSV